MDQYSELQGEDIFMNIFKYYKSNKPKPALSKVITTETATDKVGTSSGKNVFGCIYLR